MDFVVPSEAYLDSRLLVPSLANKALPCPVQGQTTTYHFLARNAIFHGLKVLGLKPGDKVFVPAFHCRTVIEPIIYFGCKIVFYNILRNGQVDFQDIHRKMDSQIKSIVAIHYFGIIQPVHQLQSFCQQNDLFFIEDCAHILAGDIDGAPVGSFGDISIFSWRKFLPLYDGGILVCNRNFMRTSINWDKLNFHFEMKIVKNLIEKAIRDLLRKGKHGFGGNNQYLAKSKDIMKVKKKVSENIQSKNSGSELDRSRLNWPMSRWSKAILRKIDIPSVVQRRKANTRVLHSALNSLPGVQPWSLICEPSVCAWAFPMIVLSQNGIHIRLREKGIQAFTWGESTPHPSLPLDQFPDAKFLYERLVFLPNHQGLSSQDLQFVIEEVKEILYCHSRNPKKILQ